MIKTAVTFSLSFSHRKHHLAKDTEIWYGKNNVCNCYYYINNIIIRIRATTIMSERDICRTQNRNMRQSYPVTWFRLFCSHCAVDCVERRATISWSSEQAATVRLPHCRLVPAVLVPLSVLVKKLVACQLTTHTRHIH